MFQLHGRAGGAPTHLWEGQAICSNQASLTGWGPLILRWAICSPQSTNSDINLIQNHPPRHTQNTV